MYKYQCLIRLKWSATFRENEINWHLLVIYSLFSLESREIFELFTIPNMSDHHWLNLIYVWTFSFIVNHLSNPIYRWIRIFLFAVQCSIRQQAWTAAFTDTLAKNHRQYRSGELIVTMCKKIYSCLHVNKIWFKLEKILMFNGSVWSQKYNFITFLVLIKCLKLDERLWETFVDNEFLNKFN